MCDHDRALTLERGTTRASSFRDRPRRCASSFDHVHEHAVGIGLHHDRCPARRSIMSASAARANAPAARVFTRTSAGFSVTSAANAARIVESAPRTPRQRGRVQA